MYYRQMFPFPPLQKPIGLKHHVSKAAFLFYVLATGIYQRIFFDTRAAVYAP
jgi:hypothetical protein